MTTSDDTTNWVDGWLEDFRSCLAGTHGHAWRARAERELRTNSPALVSDHQRAAAWRRVREEILGTTAA